jgi:hypothetical protein
MMMKKAVTGKDAEYGFETTSIPKAVTPLVIINRIELFIW